MNMEKTKREDGMHVMGDKHIQSVGWKTQSEEMTDLAVGLLSPSILNTPLQPPIFITPLYVYRL
jgi:hypothetical protein